MSTDAPSSRISATRVITPAARKPLPWPRWPLPCLGAALLAQALLEVVGGALPELLAVFATMSAVVGAFSLCSVAEERLFFALASRNVALRLLALIGIVLAALPSAVGVGVLLEMLPDALGFSGWIVGVGFASGFWLAGAAMGSLPIVFIDVVVSALVPGFRARIQAAVLALVTLSALLALAVAGIATAVMQQAKVDPSFLSGLSVDDSPEATAELRAEIVAFLEDPVRALLFFFGVAAVVGLPAALSATAKLAEAVLERFHPLSIAFDEVAAGARDVRVEEKGSRDLVLLVQRFNRMVEALALAERMERAFGVYASRHILSRIRAQHGEASIPAQLKEASVFFADVRGFTAMSERLSPEQVVGLLNRYFERVVALIEEHDGFLNKFIGDAVVVVFNGPVDQQDHAERATRCAIRLQELVARMNEEGAFPEIGRLDVGVGVSTGPMVCGNVGSARQMEYTVIGDAVNLAARLTSKAAAGEVWISEATARALPSEIPSTAMDSMHVKGKERAVVPHRVWPPPVAG